MFHRLIRFAITASLVVAFVAAPANAATTTVTAAPTTATAPSVTVIQLQGTPIARHMVDGALSDPGFAFGNNYKRGSAYSFAHYLEWFYNPSTHNVTSTTNICFPSGGFYTYTGCQTARGALGHPTVVMTDVWHFQTGCCCCIVHRDPDTLGFFRTDGSLTIYINWT